MDIRATIEDGVMVDDGQGHFDGLASVTWWTSVIGSAGCRAAEYAIPPSKTALAGVIDATNQLVVRITFEPKDFSGFATCGPSVATGNVGMLDPVTVTVPTTGGTSAQAHSVTARNGSFAGLVAVVVSTEVTSPVATSPRATSPVSRSPVAASPVAPPAPATPLDTSRPVLPRVPTAAAPTGLPLEAILVAPSPRSTLSGGSATFSWTAGTGADGYWLDVGPTAGSSAFSAGFLVGLSKGGGRTATEPQHDSCPTVDAHRRRVADADRLQLYRRTVRPGALTTPRPRGASRGSALMVIGVSNRTAPAAGDRAKVSLAAPATRRGTAQELAAYFRRRFLPRHRLQLLFRIPIPRFRFRPSGGTSMLIRCACRSSRPASRTWRSIRYAASNGIEKHSPLGAV